MAGKALTAEQEAKYKEAIEAGQLAEELGDEDLAIKAYEKAAEIRANRTLTDDIVDFVKFDPARVAGQTGRYLAEGLAGTADIGMNAARAVLNQPLVNWSIPQGAPGEADVQFQPGPFNTSLGQATTDALPEDIFPKPRPGAEEAVAQASRFVAGGGPFVRSGQVMAKAPGILGPIGQTLSSQPAMQAASAASAGASGEYTRQQGGSPLAQFGTSLVGGLLPAGVRSGTNAVRSMLPASDDAAQVLSTVDMTGLSIASRKRLEKAVSDAMKFGELDPAALKRLVDFERVGATPTQASVTLDPVQKTQQKNLAKIGAQSTSKPMQQLAQIENQNNRALVGTLDDLADNTAAEPYVAGRSAMDPVASMRESMQSQVDDLYAAARGTEGRSLPLNRTQFTERANQLLTEGNLIAFVPKEVKKMMNDIAYGQVKVKGEVFETPFNVDTISTLKTILAAEQRSAKGSAKAAIGAVRQALDETQPVAGASAEAMAAFNKAKAAARSLFQWEESAPGIKAIVDGATPETFMDKYILSKTAGVDDVRKLADVVKSDPDAFNALKFQIAAWLRDKAAPTLIEGEGRLNSASLNRALKQIGDRKLAVFFSPDEIETIKATNRVAFYDAYQPPGSAVNNSSSGTMLTGGLLNAIADKSPTARFAGSLMGGMDSMMFNPGRARQQLNPNLLQGGTRPPLLPSLATPMALPLLPQPNRDANR